MSDRYDDEFEPFDPYEDLIGLTGNEDLPQLEDPFTAPAAPPRSPLLIGLIVGLLLVVISIAAFQLVSDDDADDGAAATSTTAAPGDETTTAPADTTVDGSGTTAEPGSSAVDLPEFVATGDPVGIENLTLAVDAIGPIRLGTSAPRSIGRLIASLGPPDEDSGAVVSTGAYGTCVGNTERIVRWGPLVAVVVVDEDRTQTFAGYRLDLSYGGFSSPAAQITTLSGLELGNSVATLERIYEGFEIEYKTHPELDEVFELRSSNTGNLLLWGPVSNADNTGFVRGIYSVDACGRFAPES